MGSLSSAPDLALGLPFLTAVGLAVAALAPFLVRAAGPRAFLALALYPAGVLAWTLATVEHGVVGLEFATPWVADLGIELAFRLDGLSRVFVLLIATLGTLILIYCSAYFPRGKPNLGRFAAAFVGFMAAMLGLVLSDDLISLFVFWELTSITSFLLIGFYHREAESRVSAQQAFLLTGAGGLALMAGLVMLAQTTGTYRLSEMTAVAPGAAGAMPAFLLILTGCVTKSAQFPFHFWLPNAMAGPTPVSAFLHSATMVKAGVFLLARLRPTLEGLPLWTPLLSGFGAATVLAAFVLLFRHRDLKKLLAYSTLGMLGMLVFILGQPGPEALKAFVALLTAHALYKGAFFLLAGNLDHAAHTRDVFALHGWARWLPASALAAALAAASALGLVGFLGFLGKEYTLLSATQPFAMGVVGVFAVGAALVTTRLAILPFWSRTRPERPVSAANNGHGEGWALALGPVVLGALGLVLGLGIGVAGPALLTPMGQALSPSSDLNWSWKTFPGVNLAFFGGLVLAGVGIALGVRFRVTEQPFPLGPDRLWRTGIAALPGWCAVPSRWIQTGRVRHYVAMYFVLITAGVWFAAGLAGGLPTTTLPLVAPRIYEIAIVVMSSITLFAVTRTSSRIAAVCMLGIVGTGIAILFLSFGAPDLALTQVLTELLFIVIAVLVFQRLPRFRHISSRAAKARDLVIAGAFGGTMTLLVLAVNRVPFQDDLSRFFATESVPGAKGRNVVNTILVDFRALDTLGEATVLGLAAIGVYALMHLRGRPEDA